jgi:hypothetical protein
MTASRREQLRGAPKSSTGKSSSARKHPWSISTMHCNSGWSYLYLKHARGGVASLHHDYVLWCVQELEVPCSFSRFQQ